MSESPPNRNPAYQAVVRRLLANRPSASRPSASRSAPSRSGPSQRKAVGKSRAKPASRKKAR